ncbi:MAG: alanine--glyoxylate aminotransferase family protein [Candidatus Aminicenantes bacterium]|nr:MAG: alanine--glyoxylate aminotransferase family protein [Candidatus Aminicenantes bacterium]
MKQEKLLLIPGPTPVHPRILNALSQPTLSHVSPVFVAELKEALANLKKIVFNKRGESFIVAGAGTLAMEMALLNTFAKQERLLILSQGFFGQRMEKIARSFGLDYDVLRSEQGKAVEPGMLDERISQRAYAAVAATHVDTATGVCAPIREYAQIIREYETFFIVDGVCATGGIEERMDEWEVDIVLTAAQKCFGVPPGLAVLVVSERVIKKRESMKTIPAFYADLLNWLPIMKDPSKYFSTPSVNEMRAFLEGTKIMLEEGMENRFARHSRVAQTIRTKLLDLGFSFVPENPYLADTLSVVRYPDGIEDGVFRKTFAENGVIVAGGLGDFAGKVFRMGHMGNLSFSQVDFALDSLEKTLASIGYPGKLKSNARMTESKFETVRNKRVKDK